VVDAQIRVRPRLADGTIFVVDVSTWPIGAKHPTGTPAPLPEGSRSMAKVAFLGHQLVQHAASAQAGRHSRVKLDVCG
jgi:hypothetical protein